ncbi:MAG: hypothetical protein M1565_07125, partial [Actinobacteria bacterium]|nr:hypothetical protein [Actinomycetota bacterium]
MNSAVAMAIALAVALIGYYWYARFVDSNIIKVDPNKATPAKLYMDGVDFMPTSRHVLFGYQFKSIAALGPVVGPIIAVQWGWVPGFLWLILGVFIFGWAHDYSSAMLAIRNDGQSFGALAYRMISPRARGILLAFIYFYLILIIAAFVDQSVTVMAKNAALPMSVLGLMVVGVATGLLIYRARVDIILTTVVMVVLSLVAVWLGTVLPIGAGYNVWLLYLLLFCYLGAVLPIWLYAQPINYIAFYMVFLGIVGAVIGIFIGHPDFNAPAFTTWTIPGTGWLWPMLFVTIACGAISGWHGLLSSTGTARQLERETDTRYVVAGSMFTEMILGVLALIIAGATFASFAKYKEVFAQVKPAGVFAVGMSSLLSNIGVPAEFGKAFAGAMFVILAITVLQLAVRFARVATAEIVGERSAFFRNQHVATVIALILVVILVKTGTFSYIWTLFGGSNQLMAALALMLVSIWLASEKRSFGWAYYPMWFMLITTIGALVYTTYSLLTKA